MTGGFFGGVPSSDDLGARFSFIDNELLKSNIVIYFRYIVFLLRLSGYGGVGDLKYALYKDIIVYTASIVESLLEYTIEREVTLGRVDDSVMGYSKKSTQIGKLNHACDELSGDTIEIVQVMKYPKLGSKDRKDFHDITLAAKKAKILDDMQYKNAEELRKRRNTIHIATLTKSSDDYFDKKEVEEVFGWTHEIIGRIERCYGN